MEIRRVVSKCGSSGRGTMLFGGNHYAYYVVNSKVFRLVTTDIGNPDIGSAYAGVTGITNATLHTTFVFTDGSNFSSGAFYSAAGLLTADGNGNVSGFADVDENGTATSAAFTGTCSLDNSGYGTITITPGHTQEVSLLGLYLTDPTINFSDPNSPADAGLCGLIIDLDSKLPGSGLLILPATGTPTLSGNFALSVRSSNSTNEADTVGVATITGTSFTGTVDLNDLNAQVPAISVAGTLAPDATHLGRFTLPLVVNHGTPPPTLNYVLYQASSTQIIVSEVDSQFGLGILEQQR